ncbi:EscF/YscF/HrpA family type III secretion system needle major subunit [Desulfocurvus sp.]|jgi:type III secretion protein F|uniref:EscF/YscF/HrpA family type III secretion system needle major subunit n=1 Tax=Desulfocurvus sp. TaxID=2871698 RepID=UPI0025BF06B4|nr:EscF/YscF/HrpA family type III secretion system needle major subunit [Desulfocurvus sp.]MCK9239992.1 type III secretion protein [Desulfocurvus sp.]
MAITTNMTISESFNQMTDQLSARATTLKTSIQSALKDGDLDPMKMLQLQFDMGNYNAMVEATSSVTKGLTDTAKTLAQRAGG